MNPKTAKKKPRDPDPAPPPDKDGAGEPPTAPLVINAQYIKDLSFETPTSPGIFGLLRQGEPDLSVSVDVNARPLEGNAFEVVIVAKAHCKIGETVAFILELSYGGLFRLNVPREHLQPMLLIECPRLLFPFARYIISDVTRDGGFPPLLLAPVDFAAMYQNHLRQLSEKDGAKGSSGENGAEEPSKKG